MLPVFLKIQPSFSPLSTLIHDRDPLFQGRFPSILNSVGCKIKLIQPRCPEQNGYIESFIKTFKTECLNHVILRSVVQLRYVVNEFLIYYNKERPHSGLDGKFINPWPQDADGEIVEFSRLGGLLKSYRRVKQAA
ncbi:MAG: transposase [Lentisphaeria bacterium]|nr:transposase [Lentisphaeria bacterium]